MIKQFLATVTVGVGIALSLGNVYADGEEEWKGAYISLFDSPEIPYQGSATWTVQAYSVSGAELTYQWYYDDAGSFWDDEESRTPLVGETSDSLVISYGENLHKAYYVIADDGIGAIVTGSYVTVNSGLTAYFESNDSEYDFFEQIDGESVTAKVIADTPQGTEISYQWRAMNPDTYTYEDIEGADSETCTFSEPGDYSCLITDGIGEKTLMFSVFKKTVYIDEVIGGTIISDDKNGLVVNASIKKGEEKKVDIKAHSTLGSELTYEWYEIITSTDEDGYIYEGMEPVDNYTSEITIDKYGKYICIVGGDGYSVVVGIRLVPGYEIEVVQETTEYTVNLGEKKSLNFEVNNPEEAKLIYVWSRNDKGEKIAETTAPKLDIEVGTDTPQVIECYVYIEEVSENTLAGVATFALEITGVVDEVTVEDEYITKAGQTLSVKVVTDYPDLLEYKWYYCDSEDGIGEIYAIEGADSSTYTLPKKKSKIHNSYVCSINLGGYQKLITFVNKIHGFEDVFSGKFYSEAVSFIYAREIMTGYNDNEFGVFDNLKREQMVTLLWKAQGKPETGIEGKIFKDIEPGKYYTAAVAWAKENGIVEGYTSGEHAGEFGKGNYITRQEFVLMLYRYAEYIGLDTAVETEDKYLEKTDSGMVSGYAKTAVNWGYSHGFIGNKSDLKPKEKITRAETAVMIMRFYEYYGI